MVTMGGQNYMQLILVGILLLCGYFYIYQAVAKRTVNRSALPIIAIVLLLIYLIIAISLVLVISQMGGMDFVFLALLVLLTCLGAVGALYFLYKNFRYINKGMLVLFVLYLMMVGYITIFSRGERKQAEILLQFDSISEALRRHSFQPLQHLWLNIVMFVPVGLLFPFIQPQLLNKWRYILPLGLMLTTLIETTQLLLRLGQCDLEDLVANTLGACLGLLAYRLYARMRQE